jgi:hypothetical protein
MLEPIQFIRKAIITRLTNNVVIGGVTFGVYNRVPSSASFPYILVYSVSSDETDFNQTSYITETITRIEVVTRFASDSGGELTANQAINRILELIRTRSNGYFDLSTDGFNVFTCVKESSTYMVDDERDHTYFRGIVEISNKIQQTA